MDYSHLGYYMSKLDLEKEEKKKKKEKEEEPEIKLPTFTGL